MARSKPRPLTPRVYNPVFVAIGDLNGDGKLDLACRNGRCDDVSVLLGNGNGTFQPQTTYATGSVRSLSPSET